MLFGFRDYPLRGDETGTELLRLDHDTLRPLDRLRLGRADTGSVLGPDDRTAAFGSPGGIVLIDLGRMEARRRRVLPAGHRTFVLPMAWPRADVLYALQATRPLERGVLLVVDPRTGRIRARRTLDGVVLAASTVAPRAVLALMPLRGIGRLRVLLVDPSGKVRSVTLQGILAGRGSTERKGVAIAVERYPGLAFDRRRVLAVEPGGLVAEVEIPSLRVRAHRVRALVRGDDRRFEGPTSD